MEAPVSAVVGFKTVAPSLDGTIERPAAIASLQRVRAELQYRGKASATVVSSQFARAPVLDSDQKIRWAMRSGGTTQYSPKNA